MCRQFWFTVLLLTIDSSSNNRFLCYEQHLHTNSYLKYDEDDSIKNKVKVEELQKQKTRHRDTD